jgi:YaiO family outer membrane protein
VLVWQGKDAEALAVLEEARSIDSSAAVLNRRGRVLARMGRLQEARAEFSQALRLNPNDKDARSGLRSLPTNPRHQLRIGIDTDTFNYTDTASAQSFTLISRWRERWTTNFAVTTYQRFDADAQRITTQVTRRIGARTWVTAGAGVGHDEGIIPRRELSFECGRTVRTARTGLLRGVELSFGHHSLWFRDARVQTISGTQTLYLPRDWSWSLTLVGARSSFPASGAEWRPSGSTRLWFPVHSERLRGSLVFAVGAEDFAKTDQVGHFAARTFGGGLRCQLTRFQDIGGYLAQQDRSQGRSQTTFGLSYGIRF